MRDLREVSARLTRALGTWLRVADQELDLRAYGAAILIGSMMEAPVLYAAGLPPVEIAYTTLISLLGALGASMLVELWLHYRS